MNEVRSDETSSACNQNVFQSILHAVPAKLDFNASRWDVVIFSHLKSLDFGCLMMMSV